MTVDVEDYFHVQALAEAIPVSDWEKHEYRAGDSTRRLLELFAQRNVRATFFVLGWVAKKDRALIRQIADAGHEVACHGWSHQLVYSQSAAVFADETRTAKALLEDIIGSAVIGYRAASYSITRRSLWALDILCDLGFRYDSSIFPVRHDNYGIPGAAPHPGRIQSPSGQSIVEFPLSTVSVPGLRLPIAGGGYFRILPYALSKWGLASVNRSQGVPFVFYLHPWEIDPQQPRIAVRWKSRFRHYTNLDRCKARLVRLLEAFQFSSMATVLEHQKLL